MVRISSEARRILGMLRAKATKNKAAGQDPLDAHIAAKYGHRSDDRPETDVVDDADEIAAVAG